MVCVYCLQIFASQSNTNADNDSDDERVYEAKLYRTIRHQPSLRALLNSSKYCAICRLLSTLFPNDFINTALLSPYSRLNILTSRKQGDLTLNDEAAIKRIEMTTQSNCRMSDKFAVMTSHTRNSKRAIWSGGNTIHFNDRLPVLREWIGVCDANHPNCASAPDHAPTRLVDVGILDSSGTVKLVLTNNISADKITYATLSHCWGMVPMSVSTTKATLESHLAGFDFWVLPKNFRDAIEIARALLIPYIWIDSLCIIQDDVLDWRQESAQMASVYNSSNVTIAAASASDSMGGCFIDNALETSVVTVDLGSFEDGSTVKGHVRHPSHREGHFRNSPLHSRGWILQELVLSRRVIYFTSDQWYWGCRTARWAEDGMAPGSFGFATSEYLRPPPADDPRRPRLVTQSFIDPGTLAVYDLSNADEASSTWWQWVVDFSNRKLTKGSDRYAALAGITTSYQRATGDKPILGLWESSILRDLLWSISTSDSHELRMWCVAPAVVARYEREAEEKRILRQRSSREQLNDVPSWSWYAAQGLDFKRPGTASHSDLDFKTTFLGADIEWSGEPLTSSLLTSTLHLCGPVRLVRLQVDSKVVPVGDICDAECTSCRPEEKGKNAYKVSWDYYPPKEELFWGLQIENTNYPERSSSESQSVLLLSPTGRPDEYRRQGLLINSGRGMLCFRAANKLTIKLV